MKKTASLIIVIFLSIKGFAQTPEFQILFSEPLAVFEFVNNLSSKSPDNTFKSIYKSSAFNQEKYNALLKEFEGIKTDYNYNYFGYPYGLKLNGSTEQLLRKRLISSNNVNEFKLTSIGIITNSDLFKLANVLKEFTPVYQNLIYKSSKQKFEQQLTDIKSLINKVNIGSYFEVGLHFYNSVWDESIPFQIAFYPLPNANGFTASAFMNNAISAIPDTLKNYNLLLSVMLHEAFHILYDEQALELKQNINEWFNLNPSKNSRYAQLLMNEALATSLGNGYVYGKLNGAEETNSWYNRKYTSMMAKAIYPLIKEYIAEKKSIDKAFIDGYIKVYDDNFSGWLYELDNVLTDRYVLTDDSQDFRIIDQQYRYRSHSDYSTGISESTIKNMKKIPFTKMVIVSKDNDVKVKLLKSQFDELKNLTPKSNNDFSYTVLLKDKTHLIILNKVKLSTEELLKSIKLK